MNIGIPLSRYAYTPEAYAYEKYLKKFGHQIQLDYDLDPDNDINIYFMGIRPFWKIEQGRAIEIHEYQSLSTPPYAKLKNFSKKILNSKPAGRIFLNNFVHQDLNFNDKIPYIYRDMGVDKALFQTPSKNPLYDIIYCGSISSRPGLIENLLKLAKSYKVVVVGAVNEREQALLRVKNITLLGRVSRNQLPEIYRNARFGLNYTPDAYPYNIQTSTKTLEYLASGLGIISNKYTWSESFFNKLNYQPIWLNFDMSLKNIEIDDIKSIDFLLIQKYSWNNILDNSNLNKFLRVAVNENY